MQGPQHLQGQTRGGEVCVRDGVLVIEEEGVEGPKLKLHVPT